MSRKLDNSWLDEQTGISIYISGNENEEEHCHEFMEIQFVEKGKLKQIINGEEYICKTNDFMFFYVGDKHSYSCLEKTKLINVIFSAELLDQMKLNKYFPMQKKIESKVNLPANETQWLISLIRIMQKESLERNEGFRYILNNCLQTIVCILLRHGYSDDKFDDMTKKIIDLLEEDCTISVAEIAKQCNFCSNYVSLIFKKNVGMTLKQYSIKKRFMKAYELIKSTNLSVEQVMGMVNLANKTHFYRMFKSYFGKTPKEIRKGS
jgi:AraC-like DNA-binding protein